MFCRFHYFFSNAYAECSLVSFINECFFYSHSEQGIYKKKTYSVISQLPRCLVGSSQSEPHEVELRKREKEKVSCSVVLQFKC